MFGTILNAFIGGANFAIGITCLDKLNQLTRPSARLYADKGYAKEYDPDKDDIEEGGAFRDIVTDWIWKRMVSKEELDTSDVRQLVIDRGLNRNHDVLYVYNPFNWSDIEVVTISIDGYGVPTCDGGVA